MPGLMRGGWRRVRDHGWAVYAPAGNCRDSLPRLLSRDTALVSYSTPPPKVRVCGSAVGCWRGSRKKPTLGFYMPCGEQLYLSGRSEPSATALAHRTEAVV